MAGIINMINARLSLLRNFMLNGVVLNSGECLQNDVLCPARACSLRRRRTSRRIRNARGDWMSVKPVPELNVGY